MKTIDSLIRNTISNRNALMETERDRRILSIYEKYPDLRRIDSDISDIRRDTLMKLLDGEIGSEDYISSEERTLLEKRSKFIKDNCISADFDRVGVECEKCGDTGFIKKRGNIRTVCSCMKAELEKAYEEAGLGDFYSVKPSALDESQIKNSSNKRKTARERLDKVMADLLSGKDQSTIIYSDGSSTGKTFLAVCFTKIVINCGFSGAYIKTDDLMETTEDQLDDLRLCDFLVIDDFSGAQTKNYKVRYNLNRILETRILRNLFTLIVTGESPEEAVRDSDERIASKLSRLESI